MADATGGTITYSGGNTIHTFTSSGNFVVPGFGEVDYLIVAGGGADGDGEGGNYHGGGAGGTVREGTDLEVTNQTYSIVVGAGGTTHGNGGDSSALGITAGGGEAGSGHDGGSNDDYAGQVGTGGTDGGGGAGAGEDGGTDNVPSGGDGIESSISGSATYYGGGGATRVGTLYGDGGDGGGGSWDAADGTDGLGGGSGAAASTADGTGGSGVVIISYVTGSISVFQYWDETIGGTGDIEEESTIVNAGLASVKITADADHGANPTFISQDVTVTEGLNYVLTGYCYGDGKATITGDSNTDTQTDTGADWDAISIDIVADDTTLTIKLEPADDSDVAYFDSMALTEYYPADYEHTKFIGTIQTINPTSGYFDNPITEVTAYDWIGYLNKQELGVQAIQSEIGVETALTTCLTEFPNQPQDTDFDTGVESFEIVFAGDSQSSSMARMWAKLARNERGHIYSEGDGTICFRKQGTRDGSGTPAFTLDGTMTDIDVSYDVGNIYNIVSLDVKTQTTDANATTQLFNVGKGIPIEAGDEITIICNFTDPDTGQKVAASDVVTPVAAPHFGSTRSASSDDLNADLNDHDYEVGGDSVTVTLENTGASKGYVNEFIILGKRITDYDRITVTKKNAASILQVGNRKYTNRLDLIEDPNTADTLCDAILDKFAPSHTSKARINVLANITDDLASQLITAEPGTLFSAIETITGVNRDFYIDNIRYKQDHTLLWVTIEAEEA